MCRQCAIRSNSPAWATARLGKDVIDVLDASVSFGEREILSDVTWRIGPGERSGILGANGAGKSTLLGLIAGTVEPSAGRIKRGKTVKLAVLDQQFSQLAEIEGERVREVLGRQKSSVVVDGKELTPAQLLERLGFSNAHLSARVGDLSGGQRRRLQLLLVLLDEPNVMILDEPTNDLDVDMLAAMEDLLDSWPGTLLVVSHDRYLLERVTDQQYAIIDGKLRHVPGGVDEYLKLQRQAGPAEASRSRGGAGAGAGGGGDGIRTDSAEEPTGLTGAERRAAEKELASLERRLDKLSQQISRVHERMADHDQTDFEGLQSYTNELRELETESSELEDRWLELSEELG